MLGANYCRDSQNKYARDLLADLLNRASVLEWPLLVVEELDGTEVFFPRLLNAVEIFLEDVKEARLRGRRAGLFAGDGPGFDHCAVTTEYCESKESLAQIRRETIP